MKTVCGSPLSSSSKNWNCVAFCSCILESETTLRKLTNECHNIFKSLLTKKHYTTFLFLKQLLKYNKIKYNNTRSFGYHFRPILSFIFSFMYYCL